MGAQVLASGQVGAGAQAVPRREAHLAGFSLYRKNNSHQQSLAPGDALRQRRDPGDGGGSHDSGSSRAPTAHRPPLKQPSDTPPRNVDAAQDLRLLTAALRHARSFGALSALLREASHAGTRLKAIHVATAFGTVRRLGAAAAATGPQAPRASCPPALAAELLAAAAAARHGLTPVQWTRVMRAAAVLPLPAPPAWLHDMLLAAPAPGAATAHPRLVTMLINGCASWQQLEALLSACAGQLNAVHVAAAWVQLAKLRRGAAAVSSGVPAGTCAGADGQQAHAMGAPAEADAAGWEQQQQSARGPAVPEGAAAAPPELTATLLDRAVWAVRKPLQTPSAAGCGSESGGGGDNGSGGGGGSAREQEQSAAAAMAQQVSLIAWAVADLGLSPGPEWATAMRAAALPGLPGLPVDVAASLIKALATVDGDVRGGSPGQDAVLQRPQRGVPCGRAPPDAAWHAAALAALPSARLRAAPPLSLLRLLAALADAGVAPGPEWVAGLLDAACAARPSPYQAASLLWHLGRISQATAAGKAQLLVPSSAAGAQEAAGPAPLAAGAPPAQAPAAVLAPAAAKRASLQPRPQWAGPGERPAASAWPSSGASASSTSTAPPLQSRGGDTLGPQLGSPYLGMLQGPRLQSLLQPLLDARSGLPGCPRADCQGAGLALRALALLGVRPPSPAAAEALASLLAVPPDSSGLRAAAAWQHAQHISWGLYGLATANGWADALVALPEASRSRLLQPLLAALLGVATDASPGPGAAADGPAAEALSRGAWALGHSGLPLPPGWAAAFTAATSVWLRPLAHRPARLRALLRGLSKLHPAPRPHAAWWREATAMLELAAAGPAAPPLRETAQLLHALARLAPRGLGLPLGPPARGNAASAAAADAADAVCLALIPQLQAAAIAGATGAEGAQVAWDVALVTVAAARLQLVPRDAVEAAAWLSALGAASAATLPSAPPRAAALLLSAFCALQRRPPPAWFGALFVATGQRLAYFRGQELSLTLAALATLRAPPPPRPWLASAAAKLAARLPQLTPLELTQAAWAMARLRRLGWARPPAPRRGARARAHHGTGRGGGGGSSGAKADDGGPPPPQLVLPTQAWMDACAEAVGRMLPPRGPTARAKAIKRASRQRQHDSGARSGGEGAAAVGYPWLRRWQLRIIGWAFWRWRYQPSPPGAATGSPTSGGPQSAVERLRWTALRAALRAAAEGPRAAAWARHVELSWQPRRGQGRPMAEITPNQQRRRRFRRARAAQARQARRQQRQQQEHEQE
jgi:uncharacterized membrane protein YgcG